MDLPTCVLTFCLGWLGLTTLRGSVFAPQARHFPPANLARCFTARREINPACFFRISFQYIGDVHRFTSRNS
ncbi:hypothetical protein PAPYR_3616 [Paratrimastix pyriformis]|uniref:Secreted protein n=1 Tax=Paratrimastix pyriformis TaxID=342808 RepID=A0ABQ8UIH8_9EUKA|nr:hypothetical protein PAPYR_6010 [Paratrimastix pyriformis]KAJ4459029.1 hypothetical protein PAPYR_5080 [Paratrimastix pyriformis]KAJ4460227.1 hypothetical protein PAPYR_3616 [Paratrimastix pyriformis]